MTIAPPSRQPPPSNGAAHKPKNRLGIIEPASVPPDRIIVNAVEGWGKTSLVSFGPSPAILMARGETGYPTLLKAGLVPSYPAVELTSWAETLEQLDFLIGDTVGIKTLAIDALGGFERMCHEFICQREYGGDWGEKGFDSYKRGYDVSVSEWLIFLQRLDRIRAKGVAIVMLSHAKAKTFKNPDGPDYDRYSSDCHDKTWAATTKWADDIFFGTFRTVVVDTSGKTASNTTRGRKKGMGGDERVIFTQRRASYDAKNRWGMDSEITMPAVPGDMWTALVGAMTNKGASAEDVPPI